jgi:hypothetical protein
MNEKFYSVAAAVIALATTWLTMFLLAVLYQTLVPHTAPLEVHDGYATAWNDSVGGMTVVYNRHVTVTRDVEGDIHREVRCYHSGSVEAYDLPPLSRIFEGGSDLEVSRLAAYPMAQIAGTRCVLTTVLRWYPTLSLKSHRTKLPDIEFTVNSMSRPILEK